MKLTVVALIYAGSLPAIATAQASSFPTFVDAPGSRTLGNGWSGITVDRVGNRYVVETARNWIRKITSTGEVTTLAGKSDESGAQDGKGSEARFGYSDRDGYLSIIADDRGNIFVADTFNHTIRKVAADGEVTTIAGQAGVFGAIDGIGSEARFGYPRGIAVDTSGTLYVADHSAIRTISPDGVVSTLAGSYSMSINAASMGTGARAYYAVSLAVDRDRNVYVASYDDTVRKVSPAGQMTILAGNGYQRGSADGVGTDARFAFSANWTFDDLFPVGLAVDGTGNIWACDPGNQVIRKITPTGTVTSFGRAAQMLRPSGIAVDAAGSLHVVDLGIANRLLIAVAESTFAVHAPPQSQTIARGSTAVFTVSASGAGLTYQWRKDGVPLAGATQSNLMIKAAESGDAGTYSWSVADSNGTGSTGEATLVVTTSANSGRLVNVSVLSDRVAASRTLMVGTTIAGSSPNETMHALLRAVGPSLNRFGIRGTLEDPMVTLLRAERVVASNDDWGGDLQIVARAMDVGTFPLESPTSQDAAIATALVPGGYVMEIAGKGDAAGIALGEWFDATPEAQRGASTPRLVNLSARKQLGANGEILSAGFVIGGSAAKTVLLRAVGPSLAAFGVTGTLSDPMLQLFAGPTLVRENHDWGGDDQLASVSRSVDAFTFISAYSKDAALLITLKPGEYTLQVRSQNNDAGVVLAEIYEVP